MAQKKATIFGVVKDSLNRPIADVNISVINQNQQTISNDNGKYTVLVEPNKPCSIAFTYVGRPPKIISIEPIAPGEKLNLDVKLDYGVSLKEFVVSEERDRDKASMYSIDPKKQSVLPNISGSFEQLLKTLPGVTSNNELSSQYNVRGGNFDENLVYVNDIEIYRPFLPRSGQQEGLSFIHSELVENIKFSAGGFEARYGDKLSSVLDIKYKDPKKFAASVNVGMLGVQTHFEGSNKNHKLTYLLGARYWNNAYVLGTLDEKGNYQNSFSDVQSLVTWHITDNLSLSFLGSYAQNRYFFEPENRETVFGTVRTAFQLKIFFDGADLMEYRTLTGATSLVYKPNLNTQLKLIASTFYSNENEFFTVEGAYRLSDIETDLGSDNFARARSLRGVGYFINNARNSIQANVTNIGHRGYHTINKNNLQWGLFVQNEQITDRLHEWKYDDSAGFARPPLLPDGTFELNSFLSTRLGIYSNRVNGYLQNNTLLNKVYNASVTYGLRANYWTINNETVVSPRVQFSFEPNRPYNKSIEDKPDAKPLKNWMVKAAYGWYYQPPFYRELRDFNGILNKNLSAQRSIHYVVGGDMNFKAWNRPFKFITEAYYKQLNNLIPYEIDNVRLRYFANNSANGYAAGMDFRVNGEFVNGAESWASLSILKTQEKIVGETDALGNNVESRYIPRPTDQRVTAAIFFQDYLRKNHNYKMTLNLVYGTGLPFGVPDQRRFNDINRMPSYRRVDIGFSKVLVKEDETERDNFLKRNIQSAWLALEVFNLLGVNNTVSYIWVEDVEARQYAVPNYLTARRLNLRLMIKL
ncbi:MAG: carboxypeptidase regulatory-like domain-containing protein [Bacteroidia bacterium]